MSAEPGCELASLPFPRLDFDLPKKPHFLVFVFDWASSCDSCISSEVADTVLCMATDDSDWDCVHGGWAGLPNAIPIAMTPVPPLSSIDSGVDVRTVVTPRSESLLGLESGVGIRPRIGI